jgi:hypothetical protein
VVKPIKAYAVDRKTGEPTMRIICRSRSALPFVLTYTERWARVEIRELPAKKGKR